MTLPAPAPGHRDEVQLFVSVPITCLRAPRAREYLETLPCPAPATVYGMLLSLVGEEDRSVHIGAEVAIGVLGHPQTSVVLRTVWRVKDRQGAPGVAENKRPDYQELLSGLRLSVWLRQGCDSAPEPLVQRVARVLTNPVASPRFGGLSLGESTHLVDELRLWRPADGAVDRLLTRNPAGELSLPVWVDHVGSSGTVFEQFSLVEGQTGQQIDEKMWCIISPKKVR